MTISEILRRLNIATNQEERRELLSQLILLRAVGGRNGRVFRSAISSISRRILEFFADQDADRTDMINQMVNDASNAFLRSLEFSVTDSQQMLRDEFRLRATPPMLRKQTGLAVDRLGMVKPEPGRVPDIIDPNLPVEEILDRISPLLVLTGDQYMQNKFPIEDEIRLKRPSQIINDIDPEVSRRWTAKVSHIVRKLRNISSAESVTDARKIVSDVADQLRSEIRHEALRGFGKANEDLILSVDDEVIVGYTLHSVKRETSAPDHVLRDGWQFFKDNRPGSALAWRLRIIPPYRKNCLCFIIEIMVDPEGNEFHAEFKALNIISGGRTVKASDVGGEIYDIEIGRLRRITPADVGKLFRSRNDVQLIEPRDVGAFSDYFDAQADSFKRKLFGDRRFEEAKARNSNVLYRDFHDVFGNILTAKKIKTEGVGARRNRRRNVALVFRQQHQMHVQAWNRGNHKWRLNPNEEEQYRRRLRVFYGRFVS